VLISLGLTYTRGYERWWRAALTTMLSGLLWATQRALVHDSRPDWGYAGPMLILAFAYVRARLPFVYATAIGAAMIVYYNAISIWFIDDAPLDVWFADHLLVGFAIAGMAAAYGLERGARLLYLRERQLDAERQRSDDLLRNALPQAIVDRLNALPGESQAPLIADGLSEVSVLFADLVGSTGHAGATLPVSWSRSWTTCSAGSTRWRPSWAWRRSRPWGMRTWRWPTAPRCRSAWASRRDRPWRA